MVSPAIYAFLTLGSGIGGMLITPLLLLFFILIIGYIVAGMLSLILVFEKKMDYKDLIKSTSGNWTTVKNIIHNKAIKF